MLDDILDGLFDGLFSSSKGRKMHGNNFGKIFATIAAIVIFVGVAFGMVAYTNSGKDITCTVTNLDRVARSDSSGSDARVYTKDCGVLENVDAFLFGKHNSADVQGQIQPGKTYNFHVVGWRIPLFSSFPNITKVQEK